MQITINNNTTVNDVQQQFTAYFPFLQIQFFRLRPDVKSVKVNEKQHLKQLVSCFSECEVRFTKDTTVTDFQQTLEKFGYFVQVFRRFGSFWIATSLTDDWSLE